MSKGRQIIPAYALQQGFENVFPQPIVLEKNPTTTNLAQIGQLWINRSTNGAFILTSIAANVATWVSIIGGATNLLTLTGNSGGAVAATANNITVVGTGTVSVAGNPGTSTLTISNTPPTITGNSGGAVSPTANNYTLVGSGIINVTGNPGTSTLTISATTTGLIQTLTGNSGGAVGPGGNNINIVGSGTVSVTGNPGTNTLTITNAGSVSISFPTDAGTATPSAGVLNVFGSHGINTAGAGNNVTVAVNNALTLGDLSPIATGSNALTCTTGDIAITAGNLKLPNTAASDAEGEIIIGGNRFLSNFGTVNTFVGSQSGNVTLSGNATNNTGVGAVALNSLVGTAINQGAYNTAVGSGALQDTTNGSYNTCVGYGVANNLTTGNYNVLCGSQAGLNYTSNETSNVIIGVNAGTTGESNVVRIGGGDGTGNGQQNKCYISGINGNSVSNMSYVTIDTTTGQLGTSSSTSITWTVVTAASVSMSANMGYIANRAGTVNFTLPATAQIGDMLRVTGINTALGWQISQNANQQIFFGTSQTTLGVGGYLASTATRNSVELVCVVAGASTVWNVLSAQGNITVV